MKKSIQIQIFTTWLLTLLLSAALTFALTIIFAAPVLLDNEDVIEFWRNVAGWIF